MHPLFLYIFQHLLILSVLELILWCLLNYHQGSSMLETIFLFLIVSSTVESQIVRLPKTRQRDEGREVRCARGWVRYDGGYTRDNWRIDGGCFTPAARFNQWDELFQINKKHLFSGWTIMWNQEIAMLPGPSVLRITADWLPLGLIHTAQKAKSLYPGKRCWWL